MRHLQNLPTKVFKARFWKESLLPLSYGLLSSFGSSRPQSSGIRFIDKPNSTSLKRGGGGRSSFSGIICTVFGATGYVGGYVCSRLGRNGTQMIIPYRGDSYDVRHIKLMGDLGQVLFLPYHLCDENSIRKAVRHSNAVINLVGRDWNTRNFTMTQANVEGPARIARISKEMGVKKFIHVSSLNCNMKHEGYILPGGSEFLRTKGESEKAVREAFPEAVIFRPSDVYGQGDRFLWYYFQPLRYIFHYLLPVPKGGRDIWKQPVYVGDFANGIVKALTNPDADGKTFEAVGSRRYELRELLLWIHRVTRRAGPEKDFLIYDIKYDPISYLKARLFEMSTSRPVAHFTREKLEREAVSDTTFDLPTLEDLGVKVSLIEDRIEWDIARFKADAYYDEYLGEFAKAPPPKYVQV